MGGGGSSGKTTNVPWTASQPYLIGDTAKGTPGVFPEAAKMYGQGGITGDQQNAVDLYRNFVMNQATGPDMQYASQGAGDVMRGAFDANFGPVANAQYGNINASQNSLNQARQAQGALDPTQAMRQMLSGQPNNPYLNQQAQAITGALTRNMQENVMPGIRSEALASGQYGGSRQGIAEGLAASRLNQDLAPALTNLYGNAYESAQQRMYGASNALNDQAFQNSAMNTNLRQQTNQFNAQNNMTNSQFNANLGLQNNQQMMQRNQQNLQGRLQGLDALNQVNNMQNQNFNDYFTASRMPQDINWQNLMNYSGIMQPGSNLGSQMTQTAGKNRLASGLGGAMSGAAAGAMIGSVVSVVGTAVGALGGAILGGAGGALA